MKYCRGCDSDQPTDQFGETVRNSDGLKTYCKRCCSAQGRATYARRKAKQMGLPLPPLWKAAKPAGWAQQPSVKPDTAKVDPPGTDRRAPKSHAVLVKYCEEIDPSLLRSLAGHLEVVRVFEELAVDDWASAQHPQQKRVWLDACNAISKALEARRAEKQGDDRAMTVREELVRRLNMTSAQRQAELRELNAR